MKRGLQEFLATAVVIAPLIFLPVIIFQNSPWNAKGSTRVIHLTGVKKNGIWTNEEVNGLNYWHKTFRPANIVLYEGEKILLRLSSSDVTHTFYAPELNIGPIEVESGHTVEVPLHTEKAGVYTYYCLAVCGECHYFMRGSIKVLAGDEKIESYAQETNLRCEIHNTYSPVEFSSFIERGKYLYKHKGCITCHGDNGKGGVYNPNYVNKFIPQLNNLADKMKIYEKANADIIIKLLKSNTNLDSLEESPPIDKYNRFLAQYHSIHNKILNGSPLLQKLNPDGPKPPLYMPAWEEQLSTKDINAILTYLISQFPWEEN